MGPWHWSGCNKQHAHPCATSLFFLLSQFSIMSIGTFTFEDWTYLLLWHHCITPSCSSNHTQNSGSKWYMMHFDCKVPGIFRTSREQWLERTDVTDDFGSLYPFIWIYMLCSCWDNLARRAVVQFQWHSILSWHCERSVPSYKHSDDDSSFFIHYCSPTGITCNMTKLKICLGYLFSKSPFLWIPHGTCNTIAVWTRLSAHFRSLSPFAREPTVRWDGWIV